MLPYIGDDADNVNFQIGGDADNVTFQIGCDADNASLHIDDAKMVTLHIGSCLKRYFTYTRWCRNSYLTYRQGRRQPKMSGVDKHDRYSNA